MAAYSLLFGTAGALGLTVVTALEAPLDTHSAATPASLLAANRTAVLRQLLVLIPTLTAILFFGIHLIATLGNLALNGRIGWSATQALFVSAVGGLAGSLSYAITFTTWGQWLLFTRIWLPLAGRLPWKIIAFLEDAYHRGVLRQAGAVYQFRHARLQQHLRNIEVHRSDVGP